MDVIRRFLPGLLSEALTEWQWRAELAGKRPLVTSAFGDVFLQGDDGVWFLDAVEGKLSREWDSASSLQAQLNTAASQIDQPIKDLPPGTAISGIQVQ